MLHPYSARGGFPATCVKVHCLSRIRRRLRQPLNKYTFITFISLVPNRSPVELLVMTTMMTARVDETGLPEYRRARSTQAAKQAQTEEGR